MTLPEGSMTALTLTHHRHRWQPNGAGEGCGLHAHGGGDVVRGGAGEALEADVLQPVTPGHHDVGDLDTCTPE